MLLDSCMVSCWRDMTEKYLVLYQVKKSSLNLASILTENFNFQKFAFPYIKKVSDGR